MLRRRGPRVRRNHRVRKHALRRVRAARRVVRLARRHFVAEPLRQLIRPVLAVDVSGQRAGRGREIAGALLVGRHRNQSCFHALRRACCLIVAEEEHLPLLDRPADRAARLVLVECRAVGREVVARVERRVAEELEPGAMKHVAAGFRDDVDDPAVVVAVLRIEVVGQQAELLDRIEVGHDRRAAVHVLLDIAAVDQEAVRAFALAADRHVAGVELPGRRDRPRDARHDDRVRLNGRDRNHARLNRQQVGVAAPVQRQRRHLRRRDDFAELSGDGLHAHFGPGHGDRFRLSADFKRRIFLQRAVRGDGQAGALLRLETFELNREVVAGDGQPGK